MSDKEDDSNPSSRESNKNNLKTATEKLKAEALRRLKLGDAEYDVEKAHEGTSDVGGSGETSNVAHTPSEEQQDNLKKDETDLPKESDEVKKDQINSEILEQQKTDDKDNTSQEKHENEVDNFKEGSATMDTELASGEKELSLTSERPEEENISSIDASKEDNKSNVGDKDSVIDKVNPNIDENKDGSDTAIHRPPSGTSGRGSSRPGSGKGPSQDIQSTSSEVLKESTEEKPNLPKEPISAEAVESQQSGNRMENMENEHIDPVSTKNSIGDDKKDSGGLDENNKDTAINQLTSSDSNVEKPDDDVSQAAVTETVPSDSKSSDSNAEPGQAGAREEKSDEVSPPLNELTEGQAQQQDNSALKSDEIKPGENNSSSVGVSNDNIESENKDSKSLLGSTDKTELGDKDSSSGIGSDNKIDSGNKELDLAEGYNNKIKLQDKNVSSAVDTDKQSGSKQDSKDSKTEDKGEPEISSQDKQEMPPQAESETSGEKDKIAVEKASTSEDKKETVQPEEEKKEEPSQNENQTADDKAKDTVADQPKGDTAGKEAIEEQKQGTEGPDINKSDQQKEESSNEVAQEEGNKEGKDDEKKIESQKEKKNERQETLESNEGEKDRDQLGQAEAASDDILAVEGEGEEGEEEIILPDNFYYDYDSLASKPHISEGIPSELITLHHSFGYECTKRSNLHIMDEDILLFSAGNMVQLLNIKTQEQTYFRTTGGGGIGAIAVHPSRKYFAVAEKGIKPNINIFEYPSLKLYRVLREGTEEAYSNLDFSPDGTKLASVGSAPDFMLTIWDWKNEKILLRYKAFSQDIYNVGFSADNEGHVNTSGSGHIRFWTMANTFTGLKLQGMIGKFGAKEISDIEGFVELPDGKVLSGSDWGNMLLWEGGLIKVEISKKGKKTCHQGMIQQFFMDEGELMTIGVDGFVKVWDFESIDTADTNDEGALFEVDPMYELKVGTDVKLVSMQKAVNSDAPIWYAQDAGGGIWKLDLSFTHTSHAPERMFSYHAGHITGLDTSPVAHFVATSGEDHTVRVYDYLAKKQICHSKFNSGGSTLLWVPKLVDTKGTSILTGYADGVVRLLTLNKVDLSQVRSKKSKSDYELTLTQVFKPHTKPVTVLTIDGDGELLATGSNDSTVFFFSIGDTYKPIGFVETAAPVVSIEWSKKGKTGKSILVSCKDGTVLEVEAPQPGEHDTSKTYHLPLKNLKITEFVFKRVKDKLRKAEADAIKAKEKEAKRKKKEAERARRRERGLEEEEEQEEEEEEEEEEEPEEENQEHGPCEIIKGFYHGKRDGFFLSMDGWDAGYLYECQFDQEDKPDPAPGTEDTIGEPVRSIPVDNSNDVPIRSVYMTHSGRFLMFGMDDGLIRIHPLEKGGELENLSSYWSFSIHDNHSGSIVSIKTSFDDKYVFSCGADGNFFVHKFMDKAVKGLKIPHKVSLPSPKKLIGEDGQELGSKVDDIDDPNFYSIELEKQKAEHDRMVKLAEEKKQNVRRKITNLRRAFKQLMSRNQELPDHVQLKIEEFIIDPQLKKDLKAKTQEKIDLVHKEMAWETEKHSIGLQKLQKRFKDEIECERIVLRSFKTEHLVSTFRASKPDYIPLLQGYDDNNSKAGDGPEGASKKAVAGFRQLRRQSTQEKVIPVQQQQAQQQPGTGQSQLGGKVAKALEKAEARRLKRLNRQAQWDELYRNKPDENYEDPKDKAAIKEAKENMGDYKLKTAKDYVVPESQRVNAEKKRLQLLKLLDQIHQYKFDFNQKFLALRNKKIAIIKQAKENTVKIEEIQRKIESYARRPIPKVPDMKPDEQPEKRLEYTRERLLEFKKELTDKTKQGGDDGGGGFGGFGGFGGGGGEATKPGKPVTQQRDRSISSVSVHSGGRPRSSFSGVTEKGTPELPIEEVPEEATPLELQMQQEEQIKLQYDQDVLIDDITSMLEKFDADLRTLRHDKAQLEVALKCADLRQVTLFEEFMLLKEFEKRENVYATKVNTKLNEKDEMQDKVEDCQMKLESKKQDIDKLLEQEKALYATFSTAMGENNKFENFLTKVFKKKIKRAKKKPQTEEGSDEDSDEEDSDEDLSSSDEEDSDAEELDDSVCPPGCDQALFDQVCQLRERKLDLEELLAEEKKASETLKKECDALVKKAKVIDAALNTAEADLEAFQREKQQKLNELDVVVILRLNQVQYMINNAIPQDLSQALIFNAPGLNHLQYRIKGLEKEKHEQKRLYREHRQKHVQLIRDKKVMEARIGELEEKVQNMMMLKFGRLLDLEKLETVTVNRTVEELKEKLRQQEIKSARDIAKWDSKIDSFKEKTTQLTRENTQRLDTFTILLHEKKELEQMLDSRQKSLGTEFTGARKADLRERQRLIQLVQLQAQEIDALKDEITLLSRKGGHILPPAQPPLPPGQTPIPNT